MTASWLAQMGWEVYVVDPVDARERNDAYLEKIEEALARVDSDAYGYCEETGEPIGIKRLDARPIATLSLEAQERHERKERTIRDA